RTALILNEFPNLLRIAEKLTKFFSHNEAYFSKIITIFLDLEGAPMSIATDAWSTAARDAAGIVDGAQSNPRQDMARRLPVAVQPFLTWLTGKPAPGEAYRAHTPAYHLVTAVVWL